MADLPHVNVVMCDFGCRRTHKSVREKTGRTTSSMPTAASVTAEVLTAIMPVVQHSLIRGRSIESPATGRSPRTSPSPPPPQQLQIEYRPRCGNHGAARPADLGIEPPYRPALVDATLAVEAEPHAAAPNVDDALARFERELRSASDGAQSKQRRLRTKTQPPAGVTKRPAAKAAAAMKRPIAGPDDLSHYASFKSMKSGVQKKARKEAIAAGKSVAEAIEIAQAAVNAAVACWCCDESRD